MRKQVLTALSVLVLTAGAQIQKGYVKTKGTLNEDGSVTKGVRVPGVQVDISGVPNSVVSQGAKGQFAFQMPRQTYYLQGIKKQGYVLADADATQQPHSYSATVPLVVVVEDAEARRKDLVAVTRKIRRTMTQQLQQREDEIEALNEANRISEQERLKLLEQLNARQESNEKLISSMAQHLVSTDYDEVSEVNLLINKYILEGNLDKADSLLKSKGDITQRIDNLQQEMADIEAAEKALKRKYQKALRERSDVADDCYNFYLIAVSRYQNDSAMYYLEQRVALDTLNVDWLHQAAIFANDYLADYDKALDYYNKALGVATEKGDLYGQINSFVNLGAFYNNLSQFEQSDVYLQKAMDLLPADSTDVNDFLRAIIYNTIASNKNELYLSDEALVFYMKGLELHKRISGEDAEDVGVTYNNIAIAYSRMHDDEKALEYYTKALEVFEKMPNTNEHYLASVTDGLGVVYSHTGDYEKAVNYLTKALERRKIIFGEQHPIIAVSYNNLSMLYAKMSRIDEATDYLEKAAALWKRSYGEKSDYIVTYLGNLATLYFQAGEYERSVDAYEKCYKLSAELYGADGEQVRFILPNVSQALAELAEKVPEEKNVQRLRAFHADKVIMATVVPDSPAAEKGMSGVYTMLEYCGWTIEDNETSMFALVGPTASQPKDLVVVKDGQPEAFHFEGRIGVRWTMKVVMPEEKARILDSYRQWKKKNKNN